MLLTTKNFEYHPLKLVIMDILCRNSKDLYNKALYEVRQHFFKTSQYLSYADNYKIIKSSANEDGELPYYKLPTNASQQTLKSVDNNFKSFFSLLKMKNEGKYNERIHLPRYLDKDGKFKVIFTKIHMRFINNFVRLSLPKYIQKEYRFDSLDFKIPPHIHPDDIQEIHINPIGKNFEITWIRKNDNELEWLSSNNLMSIDLGVNNFATILTLNENPVIIDGLKAKSANSIFNYKISNLQSKIDILKNEKKDYSGLSQKLSNTFKDRNAFIKDFTHKTATYIVELAFQRQVNTIVIGFNKQWKNEVNMGKKNNRVFYGFPHSTLIKYIEYKAKLFGIKVVIQEESYTSKCDSLALEPVQKSLAYLGKRVKRGLFQSSIGKLINADVNGAINILRKWFEKNKQDSYSIVNKILSKGLVFNPVRFRII